LRQRADAFHVFPYTPHAEKFKRLLKVGKNEKEAEELLNTIHRDRIRFVKRYYDADWPTRCFYHMMINIAVGNENVISTILITRHSLEGVPREC